MSDIKLYDLKNNELIAKADALAFKDIIARCAKDVLHIDIIAKDYKLEDNTNDAISFLGLDENLQVVIIEYRYGRFSPLTKKGLYYIDYIKDHISRFKMLFNDYQKGIAEQINYHARLLILCDDANSFDHYAIKMLPYQIELIQVHYYNNQVAFEKVYQSKNIDHTSLNINLKQYKNYDLYKYVSDYLLSLGDEVIEVGCANYLIYRKINTFAYLFISDSLKLNILIGGKYQSFLIASASDLDEIMPKIEANYDKY